MISLVHLLFGAAIGSAVKNAPLAIALAFLSHYFLDLFPHIEYNIENISKKLWQKATPDILKAMLDCSSGILLITLLAGPLDSKHFIIYVCAFFAILPDIFSILGLVTNNVISKKHNAFHQGRIHYFHYKKIPIFWRILSQIIVVLISAIILTLSKN
jgi:hypothetical protein